MSDATCNPRVVISIEDPIREPAVGYILPSGYNNSVLLVIEDPTDESETVERLSVEKALQRLGITELPKWFEAKL